MGRRSQSSGISLALRACFAGLILLAAPVWSPGRDPSIAEPSTPDRPLVIACLGDLTEYMSSCG